SSSSAPGRGWAIFFGFITIMAGIIIAGIVVLAWPFDSIAILTLVVGIWLVVIGVFEMVTAFGIRKDAQDAARRIESAYKRAS
ncbi:MAG TPA: DUF308 domain-containing protein, partial [Mycobacterium sp.]|uniref:DUF308 domain-containing protein n=1 Tax=Mycobacterium sp. TaxID=1785 RepID=UPI002CB5E79C